MPSRADLWPARMCRIGIVAPTDRARRVLVEVAAAGTIEPDSIHGAGTGGVLADRPLPTDTAVVPKLSPEPIDPEHLDPDEERELLAGEASLQGRLAAATVRGRCAILPGWVRESDLESTRAAIEPYGGAIVDLPGRRGLVPPTAYVPHRAGTAFRPLITTYGTVPYVDVDPTLFAAAAYVFMFGMMFGDVAHGLAIALVGAAAIVARRGRLLALRPLAWFLVAAGSAAIVFGFLYGDAFGPTGLVPTLWIRPLDDPEEFLVVGLAVGIVLLAGTFVLSIIDRWREGGAALAVYDPSGVAGGLLLVALTMAAVAVVTGATALWWVAGAAALLGVVLLFGGLVVRSGPGASGVAQAVIELFDTLLRLGSNVVSFTRLAAFGLTHAVITDVVWTGTTALWGRSLVLSALAAILFAVGNGLALALGALVAAVQALRLEYYELFSRLFATSGRPFAPWHVDTLHREAT